MKYTVMYPTPIESIRDIFDDNIDVCVRDEEGCDYTFVFITPRNLSSLMEREGCKYIDPNFRFLVVDRLSEASIEDMLAVIMEDSSLRNYFGTD